MEELASYYDRLTCDWSLFPTVGGASEEWRCSAARVEPMAIAGIMMACRFKFPGGCDSDSPEGLWRFQEGMGDGIMIGGITD